jgi:Bacteriophage probable baseplate hub protein
MSSAVTIYERDQKLGKPRFYAPSFQIKIENAALKDNLLRDVVSVTYSDKTDDLASFDIRVNNWDAASKRLKFEPGTSAGGAFDPGQQLELRMGYVGQERLMLRGQITSLSADFNESGAPTLSVQGLDILHKFREATHTAWWNDKPSAIAQSLSSKPTRDRPGLGVQVEIDNGALGREEKSYVLMDNQYDIVFLLGLARRYGYVLLSGTRDGKNFLYFGPADKAPKDVDAETGVAPVYKLEWGRSLVSFQPRLATGKQVTEIEVRGWNRRTKKPIVKKATLSDLPSDVRKRLDDLSKAVGNRSETVVDRPIYTPNDARAIAVNLLRNQATKLIDASGATVGLPDLRTGASIVVVNTGKRFDGRYAVTSTTHTISAAGYRTQFAASWRGES